MLHRLRYVYGRLKALPYTLLHQSRVLRSHHSWWCHWSRWRCHIRRLLLLEYLLRMWNIATLYTNLHTVTHSLHCSNLRNFLCCLNCTRRRATNNRFLRHDRWLVRRGLLLGRLQSWMRLSHSSRAGNALLHCLAWHGRWMLHSLSLHRSHSPAKSLGLCKSLLCLLLSKL